LLQVDVLIQAHTFDYHLVAKRPMLTFCWAQRDRSSLTPKCLRVPECLECQPQLPSTWCIVVHTSGSSSSQIEMSNTVPPLSCENADPDSVLTSASTIRAGAIIMSLWRTFDQPLSPQTAWLRGGKCQRA
jgi:hypothetical protein